jgi:hypothetical protein
VGATSLGKEALTLLCGKTTEAIAHFIGLFEIGVEEARLREAYEEFKALQAAQKEPPELPYVPVNTKAPYALNDFTPHIPYQPRAPEVAWQPVWPYGGITPPEIAVSGVPAGTLYPGLPATTAWQSAAASLGKIDFEIEPPGSVVVFGSQFIRLSDNDYISIGGHGLSFHIETGSTALLAELVQAAEQISPLNGLGRPGSGEETASFIKNAAQRLDEFSAEDGGGAEIFVARADTLEGTYLNGKLVEEAPSLEDYLPASKDGATDKQEPGKHAAGEGKVSIKASVELEAGSNTLVNSVVITGNWLQSHVLAVAGDHFELNAIIQINAYSDSDLVSSQLESWRMGPETPTQAFNIAMFKHLEPSSGENTAAQDGGFPKHWAITEIKGDLIIMNWLEQFTFMTDEDTCILASSGVKASIIAGGNTAINNISLAELGYYYDLIIIGGNVYDANIIQQLNILLDNDLIGCVDGFQTTGEGSVSTGGNLLWNYAGIVEAGGASSVQPLPDSYRDALDALANGSKTLPAGLLEDGAYAGMAGLKVLYISGDLISLNYIKQTNVLGDSDQVALAMSALEAHPEADWTISTGSNALVNYAGIVDVDAGGTIYVGGGAYSDEILIQAELIKTEPYLGGRDPDVLVNEAVAFLGDDMLAPDPGPQPLEYQPLTPEPVSADPMQTMLA